MFDKIRKAISKAFVRTEVEKELTYQQRSGNSEYNTYKVTGVPSQDDLPTLMDTYKSHTYVYSCVRAIATKAASVPLKVYAKDTNGEYVEVEQGLLYDLLNRPNSDMSPFQLIEAAFTSLELTGECYWELQLAGDKTPINIYQLRADLCKPLPGLKQRIDGIVYQTPQPVTLTADEVIQFLYFNPKSDYRGLSPVSPLCPALALDFYAMTWNQNFFKDGCKPDLVYSSDKRMSDVAYDRLTNRIKSKFGGAKNSSTPMILEEGLKVTPTGLAPKDVEWLNLRKMDKTEIGSVFGVPPIFLNDLADASYNNAKQETRIFWENTLIPKLVRMRDTMNLKLASRFKGNLYIDFDLSAIAPLLEDLESKGTWMATLITAGAMTVNEARSELGWNAVPWGDTWFRNGMLVDSGLKEGDESTTLSENIEKSIKEIKNADTKRMSLRKGNRVLLSNIIHHCWSH